MEHQLSTSELLKQYQTDVQTGLSNEKVIEIRNIHGLNELEKKEPESLFEKIKEQFEDILVRLLLISAIISFIISIFSPEEEHGIPPWVEPCVIFSILILNAVVGIYQDYDAERALEALKDLQSLGAVVLRASKWTEIQAKELVPGDIVKIQQGDRIPADIRVVELTTTVLKTDQSILTGEVNPVNKNEEPVLTEKVTIQEKTNILFSGTLVSNGACIGVVVQTGMKTEIGKIQKEVQEADEQEEDSPLKKKLQEFGDQLAKIIGVICLVIWAINFRNFFDPAYGNPISGALYYFKVAVALAVAAIPEGLPAVITTCLALGTRRMAKENAIVRKLPSVQTLGCTTVICSDKTGTLTTNEMCVKKFSLMDDSNNLISFDVEGVSFNPEGKISQFEKFTSPKFPRNLTTLLHCMSLCNDSKLLRDTKGKASRVGLPTEAALKVLVEKIGAYDSEISSHPSDLEFYNKHISKEFKKVATLEFTRDRKSMSVLCRHEINNENILFIKGAPDYLLKNSNQFLAKSGTIEKLTDKKKEEFYSEIKAMANNGLRTLAICVKFQTGVLETYDGPHHESHKLLADLSNYEKFETEPILVGIVGLQDPPRPEVKDSIKKCMDAGISVIMITGDIKETAESVGKSIGIFNGDEIKADKSFTGMEFESLSQEKQNSIIQNFLLRPNGMIFSRTEPKHKRQLVQLLSKHNQIVAMTGDGVNDAPALKQAHIGIAMGINGTEVAKEASDMILADDNFATIVAAVEEGRAIYNNMKAFIRYMISSNIGEVVSIFLTSMIGIPDGFSSIQLLWVNLVTDGLPATALSFNPPDPDVMNKPPRKHDEPIITSWVFIRYLTIGTYVGLATVGIFTYWYLYYSWAGDNHTLVTFAQLRKWTQCENWSDFTVNNFSTYNFTKKPCSYFTLGKQKASTMSLSVIVVIEMFNAINALSEDSSLLTIGIFGNPWLLIAAALSILLHSVILYVPFFANIFGTVPLTLSDWGLVVGFSFPVILIDEVLKLISRRRNRLIMEKLKKE